MGVTSDTIRALLDEQRRFPAPAHESRADRERSATPPSTTARGSRPASRSGPSRPSASTGPSRGTPPTPGSRRCRMPTASSPCRARSGSRAGASTSPSTASTGTSTAGRGEQVAFHFEGERGDRRSLTYAELRARGGPRRERPHRPRHRRRATGSSSTCPCCSRPSSPRSRSRRIGADPLARVRRVLGRGAAVPRGGHRREAAHHERRPVPPRARPSR